MSDFTRTFAQLLTSENTGLPRVAANSGSLNTIISTIFTVIGAISVVVLVVAGLQYVVSAGSPEQTKKAKESIIYAAVGLTVSILAVTIVNFVIGRF